MVKRRKLVDDIITTTKKSKVKREKKKKGVISTGSDLFDLVIGGKFPFGIVNIVGDSSSGKSFIAGEIIFNAYKKYGANGFDWFYDDCETGYRFNTQELYGFDMLNEGYFKQEKNKSHTIEDFERNIHLILEKKDPKKPFVYVLDSFDGLSSDAEIQFRKKKLKARTKEDEDESGEKGTYNLSKQKENHAIFRTTVRALENKRVLLIVISQVKEKIGVSFGKKIYRTGGKSLDFYPNVILWLSEIEKHFKKDRPVKISTKIQATKSRNDKPFRSCIIDLVFDYGLDNITSNINFLFDLKTGKGKDKKSLVCDWDGTEYTRDKLVNYIETNDLEEELTQRVKEKWYDIEETISSKNRKKRY